MSAQWLDYVKTRFESFVGSILLPTLLPTYPVYIETLEPPLIADFSFLIFRLIGVELFTSIYTQASIILFHLKLARSL